MAITSLTSEMLPGGDGIKVTAESDAADPVFYWYKDGRYNGSSVIPFRTFSRERGEPISVQVFDDAADVAEIDYNGRVCLSWNKTDDPAWYRVYQKLAADSEFEMVAEYDARITNYFIFDSAPLTDGETYDFQVVGVGANGVEGLEYEFQWTIARRPQITPSTYTYDAGANTMTCAEAS